MQTGQKPNNDIESGQQQDQDYVYESYYVES